MSALRCMVCKASIPSTPETERQPSSVAVKCSCGWQGPAYQCVPERRRVQRETHKGAPCERCGQRSLAWNLEPLGQTGVVSCLNVGCGWWAEAF